MALIAIRNRSLLGTSAVLAPERYDPRRELEAGLGNTVPLSKVAEIVRTALQPEERKACLVLDTSDAREGIVIGRKSPTTEIGSTKKVAQPGDVLISRLRPYLRQVAYVDEAIPNSAGAIIACSTEFYVLRSRDGESVAFLASFLLTDRVQKVLAASQEGGHHPRFHENALRTLPIPQSVITRRRQASEAVVLSVQEYRASEARMAALVLEAEAAFSHKQGT